MSRLQDLIAQLCPNGVPYKTLGEVLKIRNGRDYKHLDDGVYPVYGSGGIMTYVNQYLYDKPSVLIPRKGSLEKIYYTETPFWNVDTIFYTEIKTDLLIPKFAYYAIVQQHVERLSNTGGIPSLTQTILNRVRIPVPPLAVQEEIVRILDCFTALEAELETQLQAELEARKKQYAYWRERLLTFDDEVDKIPCGLRQTDRQTDRLVQRRSPARWVTLEEICIKISSGGTPSRSHSEYFGGTIPWLRTQEVDWHEIWDTEEKITEEGIKNSSAKWIPANSVIVAMYGATAAKVAINKIPLTTNQACCNLQVDTKKANYRYVYYWLCSRYEELKAQGQGSQSNINAKMVRNFRIPVPSLEEQERIVGILDKFEALCGDLSRGLPGELALRRKQFAYYRERVLDFQEQVG